MRRRSVLMLGGPDSGKSNYVGRLWRALDASQGSLVAVEQPEDIDFVLDTADHLFGGRFAPRTDKADVRRDFTMIVAPARGGEPIPIVVPDISGELWRTAVVEAEIAEEWMAELREAAGVLLFVRVDSDLNVRPLDWVTSREWLAKLGEGRVSEGLPTQVMLCELIRFMEETMRPEPSGRRPRLSVVVSAWDRVNRRALTRGPREHLRSEYPLLAGRLDDLASIDVRVFGLSVVGGDLSDDPEFRERFLQAEFDKHGWVFVPNETTGRWRKDPDLTLPVAWAAGD